MAASRSRGRISSQVPLALVGSLGHQDLISIDRNVTTAIQKPNVLIQHDKEFSNSLYGRG